MASPLLFPSLVALLVGASEATNGQGRFITAQFPAEGFDYVDGGLRANIFDMSRLDGTVLLTSDIEIPRPFNIGNVKPVNQLELRTNRKTFSKLSELSQHRAERSSLKWAAAVTYGNVAFEVGLSQSSQYSWAYQKLESTQGYVVDTEAEYSYVEVAMRPITQAELESDFLRAFAVLPSRAWKELGDANRRLFRTFFETFGTHYTKSAKFGGSYTSSVFARACDLMLSSQTSEALETCLSARVSVSLGGPLGLDILNSEACDGFTSDGLVRSQWTYSQVESQETFQGGSLKVAPKVQAGDFASWIADVQQHPRAVSTRVASLPDLFREISGAYSLPDDFCTPCRWLKNNTGLTREEVDDRVANLEEAFVAYLADALEAKMQTEDKCSLTCGRCHTAPSDECTCPDADADYCHIEAPEIMSVYIGKVKFIEKKKLQNRGMMMHVSGLGPPYDAKNVAGGKEKIALPVDATFVRQLGDTFHVEVVVGESKFKSFNKCVGGIEFPFHKVGTGQYLTLTSGCREGKGRIGENPRVAVEGNVSFPYCCNCSSWGSSANRSFAASEWSRLLLCFLLLLLAGGAWLGC